MGKLLTDLKFHKGLFLRTVAIFLSLTISWTTLCVVTDDFTNRDKGFVSGLGFLILFSVSIYLGQKMKRLRLLGSLMLLTISTFLVASFVLGPLIGLTTNSMLLYSIANSFFASIAMTMFLDKIIKIDFKVLTMILTCLSLLGAYFIMDKFSNSFYMNYNIHPMLTMFNVFHFALIVPLTIGMTVKKL